MKEILLLFGVTLIISGVFYLVYPVIYQATTTTTTTRWIYPQNPSLPPPLQPQPYQKTETVTETKTVFNVQNLLLNLIPYMVFSLFVVEKIQRKRRKI